jgi:hypothetical protein
MEHYNTIHPAFPCKDPVPFSQVEIFGMISSRMEVVRRDAICRRGFGFYRGRGRVRARCKIGGMIYRQFKSHRASPLFSSGYILPDYLTGVKSIGRKVSREKQAAFKWKD